MNHGEFTSSSFSNNLSQTTFEAQLAGPMFNAFAQAKVVFLRFCCDRVMKPIDNFILPCSAAKDGNQRLGSVGNNGLQRRWLSREWRARGWQDWSGDSSAWHSWCYHSNETSKSGDSIETWQCQSGQDRWRSIPWLDVGVANDDMSWGLRWDVLDDRCAGSGA